jgi:hypothetical protein
MRWKVGRIFGWSVSGWKRFGLESFQIPAWGLGAWFLTAIEGSGTGLQTQSRLGISSLVIATKRSGLCVDRIYRGYHLAAVGVGEAFTFQR